MSAPADVNAVADAPACWSWVVTDEIRALLRRSEDRSLPLIEQARAKVDALRAFDGGMCAICGDAGNPVEDHCHWTGRVRGWLCRSCNTREGMNKGPSGVFGKYRQRHPYMMLGIDEPYFGFGWENGAPLGGWEPEWGTPAMIHDPWRDNAMRGVL